MITRALAIHLHDSGLVTLDETGQGTGNVFLEHLPDDPDEAVKILSTGGNPTPAASTWGYDEPTVQLTIRGAVNDPVGPLRRSEELYRALQGLRFVTLDPDGPDQAYLILCNSLHTGPIGLNQDKKGRYRFTLNLSLHIRAVTTHRD